MSFTTLGTERKFESILPDASLAALMQREEYDNLDGVSGGVPRTGEEESDVGCWLKLNTGDVWELDTGVVVGVKGDVTWIATGLDGAGGVKQDDVYCEIVVVAVEIGSRADIWWALGEESDMKVDELVLGLLAEFGYPDLGLNALTKWALEFTIRVFERYDWKGFPGGDW